MEWHEYFSQFLVTSDALPCQIDLPRCLRIINPHRRAPKKNTSHENGMLLQDTTHLIQRPCYQRGSPCQDPAGNRTTPRPPDHRKVTQTAVVWSRLQFITSGQNHFAIAYSHKSCIMNSFYESDFAEADDSHNNRLLQYFIIPHEFMVYQNPINRS